MNIVRYSNFFLSIKDLKDIDLSDEQWAPLVSSLCSFTEEIYFLGERPEWKYSRDEENFIKSFMDENSLLDGEFFKILTHINIGNLLINRKGISVLWCMFQFSSLHFISNAASYEKLKNLFLDNNTTIESVLAQIPDYVCVSKGIESNVLWIRSNVELGGLIG